MQSGREEQDIPDKQGSREKQDTQKPLPDVAEAQRMKRSSGLPVSYTHLKYNLFSIWIGENWKYSNFHILLIFGTTFGTPS